MADSTLTGTTGAIQDQGSRTPQASATPAASSPTTASEQRPFHTPADDYKAKYEELEARFKKYEPFGDPDALKSRLDKYGQLGGEPEQVAQWLAWARERAQEIQAGKLGYRDDKPQSTLEPTDPYQGWDDLAPADQARRLSAIVAQQVREQFIKPEIDKFGGSTAEFQKAMDSKMQLYMIAAQLAGQHPEVPFDEMITEATKLASQSPAELLRQAVNAKLAPKQFKTQVDTEVARQLAEYKAQQEQKEMEALTAPLGPSPRMRQPVAKAPRAEQRKNAFFNVLKAVREKHSA